MKAGRPRFAGHYQPIEPSWGYADETDPAVMRRSVQTAAQHGVDAFLWDWYFYDGDDFLNRPLNETYLGLDAPEVDFAIMWANHTWVDVFPQSRARPGRTWFPGAVDRTELDRLARIIGERYVSQPSCWRPGGAAWFTVYHVAELVGGLGGVAATTDALGAFRATLSDAAGGPVHLNALSGWESYGPESLAALGFDSYGRYNWADLMPQDQGLEIEYGPWRTAAQSQWVTDAAAADAAGIAYVPNVTMGWDSTTRMTQDEEIVLGEWPAWPVVTGNTPEAFGGACRDALAFQQDRGSSTPIIVNAWNEWTEGSYLEPDRRHGYGYLEALAAARTR